jgi:heme/copper-type cytochrome/quinol oxidase subunit 3
MSEAAAVARAGRRPEETPGAAPRAASNAWWGMVTFVATEATLFAVLIASYFYLRWRTVGGWPPDALEDPKLIRPSVMTLLLVSSSVPIYLAEAAVRRGDQGRLRLGLAVAFLLGAGFLAVQAWDNVLILDREFRPSTNAYGSMFFTITGLHGAHVAAGLLLLAWTQLMAWLGHYDVHRHQGVQLTGLYWHFVNAAGVVIFAALYLSPHV